MVNLKQLPDGSMGLEGSAAGTGGFIAVGFNYLPASVDSTIFVADRPYVVQAIRGRVDVIGSDAGAVTAVIRKVATTVALASGTALHTGSFNLKGTALAHQTLTLSTTASDVLLATGDAIAVDFTGVLTAAQGNITVTLNPA